MKALPEVTAIQLQHNRRLIPYPAPMDGATRYRYDVFLSDSSADKPVVRELAERLRTAGLRVWFDEWNIRPGDHILFIFIFIFIFPNAPKHQSGEDPKPELRKEASKRRIRFALAGRFRSPDWVAKVAFTGLAAI